MNRKDTYLTLPYFVWSIIFTVLPLLLVFFFAVVRTQDGHYVFTTDYIRQLVESREEIISSLLRSLKLSAIATLFCLLLGYPLALILSSSQSKYKNLLTTLIILPMWMNFLIRTYALSSLLSAGGFLNSVLSFFGFAPVQFLYKESTVVVGMIFNYLPFMVLPIYSVLTKIDRRLIEAAEDLGADAFKVFSKITLPLSFGGIVSGIEMVFIPSITTFALPKILGSPKLLIGEMIEHQFLETSNRGFGSILSVIVIFIVLVFMYFSSKFGSDDEREGGGLLG